MGNPLIQTPAGKVGMDTYMSFGVSQLLKDQIKEVAKEENISASELIRIAVRRYVRNARKR